LASITSNSLPFTIYSARNAIATPAGTYLGQANKKTNAAGTFDYFPQQVQACATVFLFARIAGTRNVNITRPTTTNPYIYISTRGYFVNQVPGFESTSLLHDFTNFTATMRTITTDGSIKIKENARHDYQLSALTYDFDNVCNINGLYFRRLGVPGKSNVVWMMKDIVGSDYITIQDNNTSLNFTFNTNNYYGILNPQCVDDSRGAMVIDRWNPNLATQNCKGL
jgi:hypothetical protein